MPGDISARAEVRAALLSDLPDRADAVIAAIREQIPAYAALSPGQLGEVTAIATWGIERVLDLWVADSGLGADDVRRFRGIGAARALDGRPLPGVLRAYRLAGQQLTEMVTRVAGDRLGVGDAMALANLWMATIDTLSEALYEGHSQAAGRVVEDRGRTLEDLLADLLAGRQVTLTGLADRSRELGISLPERPAVLLLAGPGLDRVGLHDLLRTAGLEHDESVLRDTTATDGPHPRAVVVAGRARVMQVGRAIDTAAGAGALRGCVVEADRADDVRRAHRLADLALRHAPDHAFARRAVLDEGDALVLALLTGDPLGDPDRLARQVLGAILDPGSAHLVEGLDAVLAQGAATAAATHLGLHPQSLRHRLRRLRTLTGRDARDPWDAFVLQAARRAGGPDRPPS